MYQEVGGSTFILLHVAIQLSWAFPGGSVVKNLPAKAEDAGSVPGSGRSNGGYQEDPHLVSLPEKSQGQRSPAGHSLGWSQI